jgi:hypothetical protein
MVPIVGLILIGVFLALIPLFALAGPAFMDWILGAIGGEGTLYDLLVKLPLLNKYPSTTLGVTTPAGASIENIFLPLEGGFVSAVGAASLNIFEILRNAALGMFIALLLIAGICFALESFKVMGEGTATSILTGSFFTLIAIFLVVPVYNAVAGIINSVTSPTNGIILSEGMIQTICEQMTATPMAPAGGGEPHEVMLQLIGSIFFFIMAMATLLSALVLGAIRVFMVGAIAAILPVFLVLRLIPVTRGVGERFIEMLIGLTLASLIAAIFLRFGWQIIVLAEVAGVSPLLATIIAFATIIAASLMPTIFAHQLGALFMVAAGKVTAAATMAAGVTAITAGGAALGAVSGVAGAIQAAGPMAATLSPLQRFTGYARLTLPAALTGAVAGAAKAMIVTRGGYRGLASVGLVPAAAIPAGKEAGAVAGISGFERFFEKRAGTVAEGLTAHALATPHPAENPYLGMNWYETNIKGKPNPEVGELIASTYSLNLTPKAKETLGKNLKEVLAGYEDSPQVLDRFRLNLERVSRMDDEQKLMVVKEAFAGAVVTPSAAEALKKFRELDGSPTYYVGIWNHPALAEPVRQAGVKLNILAGQGYEKNLQMGRIDVVKGRQFLRKLEEETKTPEKLARFFREKLGVEVPRSLRTPVHHAFTSGTLLALRKEPTLAHNLMLNLSNSKLKSKIDHIETEELQNVGRETSLTIARATKSQQGVAKSFGDFWKQLEIEHGTSSTVSHSMSSSEFKHGERVIAKGTGSEWKRGLERWFKEQKAG